MGLTREFLVRTDRQQCTGGLTGQRSGRKSGTRLATTAKHRALTSRRPGTSPVNGHSRDIRCATTPSRPSAPYFDSLNGHRPGRLYDLVMREVELPLFQAMMDSRMATRAGGDDPRHQPRHPAQVSTSAAMAS